MDTKNIMIVGVGGQGTLLASRIIGDVVLKNGFDLKVSEVHGMSQRGGSVVTYVRFGDEVHSPIIKEGEADFILSFEKLEAARYADCLKRGGIIVTNNREVSPMPVIIGAAEYPHDCLEKLKELGLKIDELDALSLAESAGTSKAVNLVLIGKLSNYFDFPVSEWEEAIAALVKPQFVEMNKKAFMLGRNA